jgi:glycosyltransferase involved in cell wall biosynthesis
MADTRLRVLHIGAKNYPPAHGGTERLVADLVDGLTETESHLFVERDQDHAFPRMQQVSGNLIRQWMTTRKYVKQHRIDLVHLHKTNSAPLGLMLKLSGIKCILTVHGCGWRRGEKRWGAGIKMTAMLLDFLSCLFLDHVVLVGEHDWLSFRQFLPARRLRLIRNGVSTDSAPPQEHREGWVYLGRISPEKNILMLLDAADALPEKLTLYGPVSPPNARFEEAFREKLEVSNARWKGPVPGDQVRTVLSRYRVFVNPSSTEGLPFTVLEAAAEGLHLVLSDIRPHRLLGFPSCDYVDPKHLDFRPLVRNTNGSAEANRRHVRREYDMETMLHSYLALYRQTLGLPVHVSRCENAPVTYFASVEKE